MYSNEGGRHYYFASKLLDRGYEPVIFCSNSFHNRKESIDIDGKYKISYEKSFPFVFIKTRSAIGNGINRILNMSDFYMNILRTFSSVEQKLGKPDIIYASSVHPLSLVAGIKIAKKLNIPCVCEIRDLWPEAIFSFTNRIHPESIFGKALVGGEHWIYKKADALIFTKEGDIDYLKEHEWLDYQGGDISKEKCFYINNGVDIPKFEENSEKFLIDDTQLDDDKFKVVYTGAIRPVNDVKKLVEAARILIKKDQDVNLFIYGQGNEKEKLEKQVKELKLDNIYFKGNIGKNYIPNILRKSDLNILNYSQTEYNWSRGNSSNKLFEYLAAGRPVLSTAKMGYSIIDKYDCGREIYDASAIEIAEAILYFKNLDKKSYGKFCNNAIVAAKDYDYDGLTSKLEDVFYYSNKTKYYSKETSTND